MKNPESQGLKPEKQRLNHGYENSRIPKIPKNPIKESTLLLSIEKFRIVS